MSAKYRIFCNTENGWQYEWRDDPIIVCPNDSTHSINVSSISIVDSSIFGDDYNYSESLGESSTTAEVWQEKLDLNVTDLLAGNYKIVWYFEWAFSRVRDPGSNFGIHIDWGAITLSEIEMTPNQTYGDGAFYGSSGFGFIQLSAGDHKIAINYFSGGSNSTTYIRRAKIEIWRIN